MHMLDASIHMYLGKDMFLQCDNDWCGACIAGWMALAWSQVVCHEGPSHAWRWMIMGANGVIVGRWM